MSEYTVFIKYAQSKAAEYIEKIKTYETEKEKCSAYNAYLQGMIDCKFDNVVLQFRLKQVEKELDLLRGKKDNTPEPVTTIEEESDGLFI